ncbi:hypothetical protein GCM10023193_54520 [Planotetraspora kaengkrachanensis]|uniref:Uncharacterized protein n=1 Tax=Planotetraspora kaengkrachanensis TaxID=575193 RepID=A0A8J3PUD2_9ACTN|nr:hypothetical protein Pka01_43370 [Planotetraspora kaengkrachanensis]
MFGDPRVGESGTLRRHDGLYRVPQDLAGRHARKARGDEEDADADAALVPGQRLPPFT